MKLSILLFVVSLLIAVSAFSDPGAYERLWYYYAYTLDTTGEKVAPGCAAASGIGKGKRCSFEQFMKYIDKEPEKKLALPKDIDPLNVSKAFAALVAARYTGAYQPNLIYAGVNKKDITGLMNRISDFLSGRSLGATAEPLQKVTKAIAALRLTESLPAVTKWLEDRGITAVTEDFEYLPGETTPWLSWKGTLEKNPGLKGSQLQAHIADWRENDPGHSGNIKASRNAAAVVSEACLEGSA